MENVLISINLRSKQNTLASVDTHTPSSVFLNLSQGEIPAHKSLYTCPLVSKTKTQVLVCVSLRENLG